MSFIVALIIGGIAGLLAGMVRKGHGFGLLGNIIVGLVGGFIGGILGNIIGLGDPSNIIGQIAISTVGAVILLGILNLMGNKTV